MLCYVELLKANFIMLSTHGVTKMSIHVYIVSIRVCYRRNVDSINAHSTMQVTITLVKDNIEYVKHFNMFCNKLRENA
jgi:hypothetical protein